MIRDRRITTYIVIALIVGVALAFAVALSRTDSSASTVGSHLYSASQSALSADAVAADVAKQQPTLDQFSSKDPFLPLTVASTSSSSSSTTTTTSSTSSDTSLSAVIKVNGATQTVTMGDDVPSGHAVFSITGVTAGDVTFKLISGQFSDGSKTVTVNAGDAVEVVNSNTNTHYVLSVTSIGSGSGGSGGGSSSGTSSHSINVASINSQNGAGLVTLVVDGRTYSDKKTGDTFSTSWGQIKILSVSVTQQTVTIMHGDATVTLNANQTIIK